MTFKKLFNFRKRHLRDPRANAFTLELLEPRVMLSAAPMAPDVVINGQLDYAPSEKAVRCISSSEAHNFQYSQGEVARPLVGCSDGPGWIAVHRDFDARGHANDRDANEKPVWSERDNEQAFSRSIGTTISITSSDSTTKYGTSVTFTATVMSSGSGNGRPAGSVSFYDGATLLGTDSIANNRSGKGTTFTMTTSSLNAGSHSIHAVFTGSASGSKSYDDSTSQNITQTVSQRKLTGSIRADDKIYDGTTEATVTRMLSGVLDRDMGNVSLTGGTAAFRSADAGNNKTVTLTGATLTGTAAGNYLLSSVRTDKANITKANAVITLTGYYGTYDGAVHQATGTATGVSGESLSGLDMSVTSHTNAGVYIDTVTFTDVTGNYKNTVKNVKSTINQANAVITVTGYSVLFDGLPHTATGTATGVLGEDLTAGLDLSSTTHTDDGTYLDVVTFTDVTGNYKNTLKNVSSRIL